MKKETEIIVHRIVQRLTPNPWGGAGLAEVMEATGGESLFVPHALDLSLAQPRRPFIICAMVALVADPPKERIFPAKAESRRGFSYVRGIFVSPYLPIHFHASPFLLHKQERNFSLATHKEWNYV